MSSQPTQYHALDGLRAVAAITVLFQHYAFAFAPFLLGLVATQRHTPLDTALSTTPLGLPFNGNFSVCIFFVLSGFVLSVSFFATKSHSRLTASASRRYPRLMLPTLATVLLTYVVVKAGLIFTPQAGALSESKNWLVYFFQFTPHLGEAVRQGAYGVFFEHQTKYNAVLWTMYYELFGSLLSFLFLALFGDARRRWPWYLIFGLLFLKTYLFAFILGVALCDLYSHRPAVIRKLSKAAVLTLITAVIFLGGWNIDGIHHGPYNQLHLPLFGDGQLRLLAHVLGAAAVLVLVLRWQRLTRLMETRPIQWLGKLSFSLFLTHLIILGSLASFLFTKFVPLVGYWWALPLTIVPSWAVSLAVAALFYRYIDVPSAGLAKKIGDWLIGHTSAKPTAVS